MLMTLCEVLLMLLLLSAPMGVRLRRVPLVVARANP